MNRNIRIARQLVKIARELVSSRPRKAWLPMVFNQPAFRLEKQSNWKVANSYDELIDLCSGIDTNASKCCIFHDRRWFDRYGAPFYVYVENNVPKAIMHFDTKQIKDIMTDITVRDEDILRSGAGLFVQKCIGENQASGIYKQFTNDFAPFRQYYDEALEQYNNENLNKEGI